jgi:hypothetical protein
VTSRPAIANALRRQLEIGRENSIDGRWAEANGPRRSFRGLLARLAALLKRSQDDRVGSLSPPSLRRLRLRREDCALAEAFVQWRGALGEVFEVRATPSEIADFRGEIDVHASARYVLSSSRHSPVSLVRRAASAAQERVAICLQINGAATGLAGDRPMRADSGDVLFLDLSQSLNDATIGAGWIGGRGDAVDGARPDSAARRG